MSRYTNLALAMSKSKYVNEIDFFEPLEYIGNISSTNKLFNQFIKIGRYYQVKTKPLKIYSAISPVPFRHKYKITKAVDNLWQNFTIKKAMKLMPEENRILFLQGPSDFTLKMIMSFKKEGFLTIFDWANLYEKDAASLKTQNRMAFLCRKIARESHVVFCVSNRITNIALDFNKNSFTLSDAVPKNMIVKNMLPPKNLNTRNNSAVVCYYGLINPVKLDFSLIEKIAMKKPNWKFVLIGPQNDPENTGKVLQGDNIEVKSPMDGISLHNYLRENIDLCLIPYNVEDEVAYYCSPLKLYESLGLGLPIVSTETFDPGDAKELISIGSSSSEIISAMEYELETDSIEKRRKRIEYAKKHTWEKRVDQLFSIIEFYKNNIL